MSSSVFKVYASSSRDGFDEGGAGDLAGSAATDLKEAVHEDLKLDSNLVILLNKDGSVSVDQNTLQSLLANETTGTSVSLVRISSPTPSIEEEIEEERRRLKDEKQREDADGASGASSNEDSNDDSNSVAGTSSGTSSIAVGGSSRRTRTMSKKVSATGCTVKTDTEEEPRHVSLTVEGFYPPSEAQNFAAQVLSLAGYEHPLRKEVVDIEYIRYTVSNDHCYTTLASTAYKVVEPKGLAIEDLDSSEESSSHSAKTAIAGPSKASRLSSVGKITDQSKLSVTSRSFNKGSALATVGSSKGASLHRSKSTFGPQSSGGSTHAKDQKRKKSKASDRETDEAQDENDDDEELEEEEDDEFYSDYDEDEESSFSEEDDELDVDFSVSGRSSSVKKRKQQAKGRNKPSPKTPRRSSITGPPGSGLSKRADKEHDASQSEKSKESSRFKIVKSVRNTMNENVAKVFSPQTAKQQQQQQQQMVAKAKAAAQSHSQSHPSKKIPTKTYTLTTTSTPGGPMTILSPTTVPATSTSKPTVKVPSKADVTHNQTKPTPPPTPSPTATAVTSLTPQKKDKKPKSAALDAAMVSDISALFSTPDIIKKVNTGKSHSGPSPTSSSMPTVKAVISEPSVVAASAPKVVVIEQPKTLPSNPILTESIPTISSDSASASAPTSAPIQASSTAALTTNPVFAEQRLDLIHAIVQEDLRQPTTADSAVATVAPIMQQPVEIPSIVKMLETTANMVDAGYDPMAQQWLMAPVGVKPMEEPVGGLLPDNNAILEALNSGEDALPEDLLEHVAELAKNKELQEILDKQVLGVIGTGVLDPHSTLPLNRPATQHSVQHPQQLQQQQPQQQLVMNQVGGVVPTTTPEYLPTLTVREQQTPRKEAIQIRRSDGRVITLPPIEAPATRASKRRAQGTPGTPNTHTANSEDDISTAKGVRVQQKALGSTIPLSQPATPGTIAVDESTGNTGNLIIDDSATAKGTKRGNKATGPEANRTKRLVTSTTAADAAAAQDDDLDSDESWNSEDDPDRLWCICRQPHNNRFMICCDSCEDWFHGKCVNITKAMGQQMEHDGIEWTCPNCLKKKADRQQPKMTEFLLPAGSNHSAQTPTANTIVQETVTPTVSEKAVANACIVCSKPAKPSSIYCSDDCIRKHAGSVPMVKTDKAKDRRPSVAPSTPVIPIEPIPSSPSPSPETIIVMERTTGRCLAGKFGPTAENIKQWLQDHPTYEVVPPGSPQAAIILKKQAAARRIQLANEASAKRSTVGSPTAASGSGSNQSPKVQTQLKVNDQKKMVIVSTVSTASTVSSPKTLGASGKAPPIAGGQPVGKPSLVQKTITGTSRGAATSPTTTGSIQRTSAGTIGLSKGSGSPAGGTPATSSVAPSLVSKPPKKPTTSSSASSSIPGEHSAPSTKQQITPTGKSATTTGGENIRVTVKKTLKEHLMQRTAELKEDSAIPRLNEEEIDRFVKETEGELFALFNKDTGMKYRAKYRSLVFNIKDRKNLSLFQKICEKIIEPKQLVRMTADELASQELAQWRENETKHQLEMIKKTELESLACAKNYVVKTHKGEELIEGKGEDRVQLDPSVPVDDVVSLLNNSAVSSTSELDESFVSSGAKDSSSYRTKDYDFGGYGKHYNTALYGGANATSSLISSSNTLLAGKPETGGGASSSSSSSTLRKKDSRRSSRSRSRSRGRKRDRDRSRDRSRSKHKRKRSRDRSHDRHTSRDRDREKERDRERDRDRDRDRHHRGRDRSRERSKHERKSSREKDTAKTGSSAEKRRASVASTAAREPDIGSDSSARAKFDHDANKDNTQNTKTITSAGKKGPTDENSAGKVGDTSSKTSINASGGDPLVVNKALNHDEVAQVAPADVVKESKPEQDQEPTSTVTIPTPPHHPPYEGESPDDGTAAPNQPSEETVDETTREAERTYWTGSVHMVDVASVVMSIRAVSGDIQDVAKDFSADLDICGTIKPELVWDYIAQIRKSTNKEICLVRFHSRETSAYYTLYNHLFTRKRYSVVKAPSAAIKDFYIFPLPAEQMVPMILKPLGGVGIIEGDQKPNLLLGVLVKIKGKRSAMPPVSASQVKVARRQSKGSIGTNTVGVNPSSSGTSTGVASSTASLMQQVITKYATKQPSSSSAPPIVVNDAASSNNTSSPVSSHKQTALLPAAATDTGGTVVDEEDTKKREDEKQEADMDVDMDIIKAPIAGKGSSTTAHLAMIGGEGNSNSSLSSATDRAGTAEPMLIDEDDDDAPYSPGGASDDSNFADVTAIVETAKQENQSDVERIKREMDELNRKIAMQKNEIVGLMTMNELSEGEINSTLPPSLINDIPIPANLSQILASIKGGAGGGTTVDDENPSTSSPGVGFGSMKGSTIPLAVATTTTGDDDEEYNPSAPSLFAGYQSNYVPQTVNSLGDIDERILPPTVLPVASVPASATPFELIPTAATQVGDGPPLTTGSLAAAGSSATGESRLAKLSDEELLRLVPDDAMIVDSSLTDP
ncbi:death-inducer obliterator 1-like [Anopheles albimanus]|uniref:Transcription factor s-ii n=1 Tax=Anopheles albimanus TaxID=7167 RepID=A0A182FEA9_ANOAL|nr:death-inducer obliterator 1-like [Anopheles albimanus]